MTAETASNLVEMLDDLKDLPESPKKDRVIEKIKKKATAQLMECISGYSILGAGLGWDTVEDIFEQNLDFIRKMKDLDDLMSHEKI